MFYEAAKQSQQLNALSPSERLSTSLQGMAAAAIASQTYANAVLVQPDVRFDVLPNFADQQLAMRTHAQDFKHDILPQVIHVSADIVDFYNTYAAYYEILYPIARNLAGGDHSQLTQFIKGLKAMVELAQGKSDRARNAANALRGYGNKVIVDEKQINHAEQIFQEKVVSDQGELKEAQKTLQSLNSILDSDIALIAAGSAGAGIGISLVVLGLFTEIPSAGTSTSVILAGLGMAVTGGGAIGRAATEFDKTLKLYVTEMQKIALLKQEISVFTTVTHQLTRFSTAAENASQAALDYDQEWGTVVKNYQQLIQDLTNSKTDAFLPIRLTASLNHWKSLASQARAFQGNLSMPVENRQIAP